MIGKIKALGLAFVAITAMSAVAAGSAQAVSALDVGTAGAGNATLTAPLEASQEAVLSIKKTGAGEEIFNSNCTIATLEGTVPQGKNQHATVTPTYTGCKLFGLAATVTMHGCKYTITTTATALTANIDIVGCTPGKKITIKNLTCTLEIGELAGVLSHVVFSNIGSNQVTVAANVKEITVTQVGAGCPDGNGHHSKNASFKANTILSAFKDTGTHQVTEHGHQFTRHTHNNEVLALTAT